MNAGSPLTSWQLGETLRILRDANGGLVSGKRIAEVTGSIAVHSDISAVRFYLAKAGTGETLPRATFLETTAEGRRIYGYRIERERGE